MESKQNIETQITKIWKDNGFTYDYQFPDEESVEVEIQWGDWKHDHRYLMHVMEENEFYLVSREITETDGSDSFSAYYLFER